MRANSAYNQYLQRTAEIVCIVTLVRGGLLYFRHNSSTQPIRGTDASIGGAASISKRNDAMGEEHWRREKRAGRRTLCATSRRAAGEKKQHFSVWHPWIWNWVDQPSASLFSSYLRIDFWMYNSKHTPSERYCVLSHF